MTSCSTILTRVLASEILLYNGLRLTSLIDLNAFFSTTNFQQNSSWIAVSLKDQPRGLYYSRFMRANHLRSLRTTSRKTTQQLICLSRVTQHLRRKMQLTSWSVVRMLLDAGWSRTNSVYNIARVLAQYKSYWAAMNKFFIYARPCVNKDFVHDDVFSCVFRLFSWYPKIDGNAKKLSRLFWEFSFVLATQTNSIKKRWRCFANNRAWMIRWKVCRKDWHLSGKRPQIGLCRKIFNLYKVSSVFNVCFISYNTS